MTHDTESSSDSDTDTDEPEQPRVPETSDAANPADSLREDDGSGTVERGQDDADADADFIGLRCVACGTPVPDAKALATHVCTQDDGTED